MSAGRVLFVGCGPGAADLLTLRAVRALETADVVIWNASQIERRAVTEHMRPDAELLAWPPATQADIQAVYTRAQAENLTVVRLKGGDPTIFGALEPELSEVRDRGLGCEIVPGISTVGAGAALLMREIATPAMALLLADASAVAAAPDHEGALAVHGAGRDPAALQRDLLASGRPDTSRCDVAIEVSRRSEMIVSCRLHELQETLEDTARGLLTLVVVTPPASPAEGTKLDARGRAAT